MRIFFWRIGIEYPTQTFTDVQFQDIRNQQQSLRFQTCMFIYAILYMHIIVMILEVGVYPNSTTFLLDKLKLEIYLEFTYYSSMDQHVLTGQSLCRVLPLLWKKTCTCFL